MKIQVTTHNLCWEFPFSSICISLIYNYKTVITRKECFSIVFIKKIIYRQNFATIQEKIYYLTKRKQEKGCDVGYSCLSLFIKTKRYQVAWLHNFHDTKDKIWKI